MHYFSSNEKHGVSSSLIKKLCSTCKMPYQIEQAIHNKRKTVKFYYVSEQNCILFHIFPGKKGTL